MTDTLILTPAPETAPCPECHATGKAPYGDPWAEPFEADDCERCQGSGRVIAPAMNVPVMLEAADWCDGCHQDVDAAGKALRPAREGDAPCDWCGGNLGWETAYGPNEEAEARYAAEWDEETAWAEHEAWCAAEARELDGFWTRLAICTYYDRGDPLDGCDSPEACGLRPC